MKTYIDMPTVLGLLEDFGLPVSHVTLRKMVRDGLAPAPRRFGRRSIRWVKEEVVEWLEGLPEDRLETETPSATTEQ